MKPRRFPYPPTIILQTSHADYIHFGPRGFSAVLDLRRDQASPTIEKCVESHMAGRPVRSDFDCLRVYWMMKLSTCPTTYHCQPFLDLPTTTHHPATKEPHRMTVSKAPSEPPLLRHEALRPSPHTCSNRRWACNFVTFVASPGLAQGTVMPTSSEPKTTFETTS